ILKDLRKKGAKENDLPPYIIFQDPSLEAMATSYPISIEELAYITGVCPGKAKGFRDEFVKVINSHVEANEIDRPEDLRVRMMVSKNQMGPFIATKLDLKVPLPEIARAKGLEFSELLEEIERIVLSGNKINIGYYVDEVLDEDSQEELFDYFRESESDSLDQAFRDLGADFTEEEIRLARIKFLSEMGN
ncbi:MAG: HRDC domain-containing protein, partial [Duncaniella sp.]|nr:HRDC domain-containing protein [Duncaniella sp.]